jgi:hypothetical protein
MSAKPELLPFLSVNSLTHDFNLHSALRPHHEIPNDWSSNEILIYNFCMPALTLPEFKTVIENAFFPLLNKGTGCGYMVCN